ncbi:MAG: helix-turn-helix domain-containing protein [Bacteroidetes bacterium]|nr:helix-turn-helix domain-containing protein [Bacteroidota bacterium]
MENPFDILNKRIDRLESMLACIEKKLSGFSCESSKEKDDLGDVTFASKITGLAIPTIYSKSSKGEIPCMKQGKKLYFSKNDLLSWIKKGSKKMISDYKDEVESLIRSNKRA